MEETYLWSNSWVLSDFVYSVTTLTPTWQSVLVDPKMSFILISKYIILESQGAPFFCDKNDQWRQGRGPNLPFCCHLLLQPLAFPRCPAGTSSHLQTQCWVPRSLHWAGVGVREDGFSALQWTPLRKRLWFFKKMFEPQWLKRLFYSFCCPCKSVGMYRNHIIYIISIFHIFIWCIIIVQ